VDLLAGADQADDDAPAGDALGEFDEVLGLGSIVVAWLSLSARGRGLGPAIFASVAAYCFAAASRSVDSTGMA